MNKIRFGLIGCGDIAHIRYFTASLILRKSNWLEFTT